VKLDANHTLLIFLILEIANHHGRIATPRAFL